MPGLPARRGSSACRSRRPRAGGHRVRRHAMQDAIIETGACRLSSRSCAPARRWGRSTRGARSGTSPRHRGQGTSSTAAPSRTSCRCATGRRRRKRSRRRALDLARGASRAGGEGARPRARPRRSRPPEEKAARRARAAARRTLGGDGGRRRPTRRGSPCPPQEGGEVDTLTTGQHRRGGGIMPLVLLLGTQRRASRPRRAVAPRDCLQSGAIAARTASRPRDPSRRRHRAGAAARKMRFAIPNPDNQAQISKHSSRSSATRARRAAAPHALQTSRRQPGLARRHRQRGRHLAARHAAHHLRRRRQGGGRRRPLDARLQLAVDAARHRLWPRRAGRHGLRRGAGAGDAAPAAAGARPGQLRRDRQGGRDRAPRRAAARRRPHLSQGAGARRRVLSYLALGVHQGDHRQRRAPPRRDALVGHAAAQAHAAASSRHRQDSVRNQKQIIPRGASGRWCCSPRRTGQGQGGGRGAPASKGSRHAGGRRRGRSSRSVLLNEEDDHARTKAAGAVAACATARWTTRHVEKNKGISKLVGLLKPR